jgi:hypothetical protein
MRSTRLLIGVLSLAGVLCFMGSTASAQGTAAPAPAAAAQPMIHASAIQVLMVQSDEVKLPIQFQLSLYEDLIEQLTKTGKFAHVYREGDKAAGDSGDLVTLHSNVFGFKEGSEEKRQVTTVAGATQIKVHCQFTDKSGNTVLEQDVTGNVRFIGGNLRATFDFAKKVAQLAVTNFQ